jgi:hypothetical protein
MAVAGYNDYAQGREYYGGEGMALRQPPATLYRCSAGYKPELSFGIFYSWCTVHCTDGDWNGISTAVPVLVRGAQVLRGLPSASAGCEAPVPAFLPLHACHLRRKGVLHPTGACVKGDDPVRRDSS